MLVILTILVVLGAAAAWWWYGVRRDQNDRPGGGPSSGDGAAAEDVTDLRALPIKLGADWDETDNPEADGWTTEAFHLDAKGQLKKLGKLLAHPDELTGEHLTELVLPDVQWGRLRPENANEVFKNDYASVRRWSQPPKPENASPERFDGQGVDGLVSELRRLVDPFASESSYHEFKVFRVFLQDDGDVITRQLFSFSGTGQGGAAEQHATWGIRWAGGENGLPVIRQIWLENFEETTSTLPDGLFHDVAASVMRNVSTYGPQFLRGLDYWFERIQDQRYSAFIGISGIAVGDVNGDGLEDLYVCQELGLPNRLFLHQPDGTVVEAAEAWGVDWLQTCRGALLVDLDNDGDQDLAVAVIGGVAIAENLGDRFELKDVVPTSDDTTSLAAADYDRDGRTDIYVCVNFSSQSMGNELPSDQTGFIIHDANDGGANSLLRNEIEGGQWRFRDVTQEVGLDQNNHKYSWAASWDDYDNDGDLDLYVANDFGWDNLYRNESDESSVRFEDVAEQAHVENAASGMSTSYGDFNRDGWMDIFISNMFSSAGNRIVAQRQFKPDAPENVRHRLARLARGNTLLKNRGDGTFEDFSEPSGTEVGRWAWGSLFFDADNDGWEDILVANGFVTTDDTGDL